MGPAILIVFGSVLAIGVGAILVLFLLVPFFKAVGWVVRHVGAFVVGEVGDALRIVGAVITQLVLFPLIIGSVLIGRWSAAGHYGRAFKSEFRSAAACVYRVLIGHPARLLCLTALTDGLEKRIPQVMAAAPTADRPHSKTTGQFEGYRIIGSLPGGGSGGKLYVAEPDAIKLAGFARNGRPHVRQVVIKTFSLKDGSSLPQIVRESRALEAAKKLGLVLEHELTNERFYYITEYVPGESLTLVTQRLHAMSGGDGLSDGHLRAALAYASDLLRTLDAYHRGGLWHKDVKPDNIIVDGQSAHLVDFGLVTPLRSGMTLTTHGTEYFRDPELVRLALKGVKVHQVDGARFDIYAAGAVLYSIVENSFPAHGGLSQITRRCPEALRWVVRRAMTDYDKRYASASAMMADLDVVLRASDPFAVRPIDLPSMSGAEVPAFQQDVPDDAPIRPAPRPVAVGAGSDFPGFGRAQGGFAGSPVSPQGPRSRPRLRIRDWWTGGYVLEKADDTGVRRDGYADVRAASFGGQGPAAPFRARPIGLSAKEQVERARGRARQARERARARIEGRRQPRAGDFQPMNAGVAFAAFLFVAVVVGLVFLMFSLRRSPDIRIVTNYGDQKTPSLAYARLEVPDVAELAASGQESAPSANTPGVRVSNANLPTPRVVIDGPRTGSASSAPAEVLTATGERVLVISDVLPHTPAITASLDRLRRAGFAVIGNIPGADPADEEHIDLAAEARAIRGLARLDAAEISEELSHWVGAADGLSLLVWFSKDDPARPGVQCHVFSPAQDPATPESVKSAGRASLRSGVAALAGRR